MSGSPTAKQIIELDATKPVWDRCYMVAPLVLVGTRDDDGSLDLAPKHMAMPMGWQNYFGFVCSATHHTYTNIERTGQFTVSYTQPSQILYTSLAASPRYSGGQKTVLQSFATFPAKKIDGEFIEDAYLFLECKHHKTIDGFGENCLITGEVVAAYAHPDYIRSSELDDQELIHQAPLLAYLPPGRFASITRSNAFPFRPT
ncbi:MAG: flavin reductase family protein [Woeseiaceae bacterium]